MKRAIIILKDGKMLDYTNEYIWDYIQELNDNRTPFINIGNYSIRKDEISVIKIIDLKEDETKESEEK